MEYLPGGLTLQIPEGAFPLSTDSMLLAHFIRLPRRARILDLGSGAATLGHLLCARDSSCTITGLEVSEPAHQAALENIRRNALENRIASLCMNLTQFPGELAGKFDCVVSNPPYFSGGPASKALPSARREDLCTSTELFAAAAKALKYGGDFFLVHRPERLAELITAGAQQNLESKRLRLVHHCEGGPVTLILLQMRKGGKPGLTIDELYLYDKNHQPSDSYREIYHIQEE